MTERCLKLVFRHVKHCVDIYIYGFNRAIVRTDVLTDVAAENPIPNAAGDFVWN